MVLKIHLPLIKSLAAIEVLCVLVACSGDSPRPPIVTNHTEAWDEQLARERREREMQTPLETPHVIAGKGYGFEEKDEEEKHSVVVTTLADILAFPLRGAAWLAHTLL